MDFAKWVKQEGVKPTFLADKLGVTYNCLYLLIKKSTVPRLALAVAIEDLTKGKVTCRDWLGKNDSKDNKKRNYVEEDKDE